MSEFWPALAGFMTGIVLTLCTCGPVVLREIGATWDRALDVGFREGRESAALDEGGA